MAADCLHCLSIGKQQKDLGMPDFGFLENSIEGKFLPLVFHPFYVQAFLLHTQYNQELARLSYHKDEFQQRKTFICGYRLALCEKQNKTKTGCGSTFWNF